MSLNELQPGDIVYAAQTIYSDGEVPGYPENSVLAAAGTRGHHQRRPPGRKPGQGIDVGPFRKRQTGTGSPDRLLDGGVDGCPMICPPRRQPRQRTR